MKRFNTLLFALSLLALVAAWGQELEPDEEGCKDSKLVSRMRGCRINECSSQEFDSAEILVGIKEGEAVNKTLEGQVERLSYVCLASITPLQIARNLESALKAAGYKIVFSGRGENGEPAVTAQSGGQWISVATSRYGGVGQYTQLAVKVQKMAQEVTATAAAWAEEINRTGRVAVYGINFDTGKATIKPESDAVLNEIVSLMNANPEWRFRVEGHTDNVGAKAMNQTLSQQRAAAVVTWLAQNGIDKARLVAQGFGDSKPAADNTTEEGRAKNRRVELAKL
jgi:outer membrane protein OmpA-like peptidoglycan-associated protein